MLYAKFQGHRPLGSEGDFLRFLPYMGLSGAVARSDVRPPVMRTVAVSILTSGKTFFR